MQQLKITKGGYKKAVSKACSVLKNGELIVIPTETVYGIAALASDENAVKKIFEIKERPPSKALPIFSSVTEGFGGWAVLDERALALGKKFWPGPLTMIVPAGDKVPKLLNAGRKDIAVRIPDHFFVLKLLDCIGEPVAATSANTSGNPEPVNFDEVEKSVLSQVAAAIDAGPSVFETPSTIIDLTKPQVPIVRPGPVTGKEIMEELKLVSCE